jgi:hypothetical protein
VTQTSSDDTNSIPEIQVLLAAFQEGYTRRDISRLNAFMELFTNDVEVIGTGGITPGKGEWYTSRETTRELIKSDWESWGDLQLDLDSASIKTSGTTGWIAATATVSLTIGAENYAAYLEYIQEYLGTSNEPAQQKLHYILRSGTNTLYELERGDLFIWPLRFTAVTVRDEQGWKFAQVNFSFPTTHYPDVRITK